MKDSSEKRKSKDEGLPMTEGERKVFGKMQALLALTDYAEHHGVGLEPVSFIEREDKVAEKICNLAMEEWISAASSGRGRGWWEGDIHDITLQDEAEPGARDEEPSNAKLFRMYWNRHKKRILGMDMTNPNARNALIQQLHVFREQIKEA